MRHSTPSYDVLLFGATGTIGRATQDALRAAGHRVTVIARPGKPITTDTPDIITHAISSDMDLPRADAIVSCMASRTGTARDAWAVDYRAHADVLQAAQAHGIQRFVQLSAICVQKPQLPFQQAKLAFEAELTASGLTYSIIRPTAFFKSLSGQWDRVRAGKPFLVFGDGMLTACAPISDRNCGAFIARALTDPMAENRILPIGGPGAAITPLAQAQMLADAAGQPLRVKHVPLWFMDAIIALLRTGGHVSQNLSDKAELARIGRYYGSESMLHWDGARYDADATPRFGNDTLADHYAAMARGDVTADLGDHALF